MSIKIGIGDLTTVKSGDLQVGAVMSGDVEVWSNGLLLVKAVSLVPSSGASGLNSIYDMLIVEGTIFIAGSFSTGTQTYVGYISLTSSLNKPVSYVDSRGGDIIRGETDSTKLLQYSNSFDYGEMKPDGNSFFVGPSNLGNLV